MTKSYIKIIFFFGFLLCSFGQNAFAEIELEIDPIAYVLKGYSFHVAYAGKSTRLDAGFFALELPKDSTNENYTVSFEGSGLKLDYIGNRIDGFFSGIQYSRAKVKFIYDDSEDNLTEEETSRYIKNYGVRIGYRFGKKGLYLSFWVSVDYNKLEGDDVILGGKEYDFKDITFFPTVHIGYRF
ncbi:MAG: hypothetical protein ACI86H_002797 [bacterium]|jgi:hypothetical protein